MALVAAREPYGEEGSAVHFVGLNIPGPLSWHQMALGEGWGQGRWGLGGAKREEVGAEGTPGWADWPAGRAQVAHPLQELLQCLSVPCPERTPPS